MSQSRNLKANKKYPELKENKNKPYKKLKAVFREKFIALNSYSEKGKVLKSII